MRRSIDPEHVRRFRRVPASLVVVLTHALALSVFPFLAMPVQAQEERPAATQATFTNAAAITFPNTGPSNGSLYPSPIVVSGLAGTIPAMPGSIKVTIRNYSYQFPDDMGFVLVGPTGAALLLQNDILGDAQTNATYSISDAGFSRIALTGPWFGVYRPTAYIASSFPAPGPLIAYGVCEPLGTATFSSVFGGTNPNGTWNLYARDFVGNPGGAIAGGWSLDISTTQIPNHPVLDFDGDGKTDVAVTRAVAGGNLNWYVLAGSGGFEGLNWGLSSDTTVPGDYDGEGKWDIAIFRNGVFHVINSSNGIYQSVSFGQAGDDPRVSQDFDGDGKTDPAVVRNVGSNLVFYLLRSTLGFTAVQFGLASSDVGIRGDFDGDGKADIAVYRTIAAPANSFFVLPSGGGPMMTSTFGDFNTDYVVPADFDGDHKTDFAVWRGIGGGSNGAWYWLRSSDHAFSAAVFGLGNLDRPVPGDYDGDGKTDLAVWRPALDAVFYYQGSTAGFKSQGFGTTTDLPPAFTLQAR
jgi:hypothetical protein